MIAKIISIVVIGSLFNIMYNIHKTTEIHSDPMNGKGLTCHSF